MKPIIGIVYPGDGLFRKYMYSKYRRALQCSGAEVKILPWAKSPQEARAELRLCSGLLLPGGNDVSPRLYGEEILPCCGKIAAERDCCEPLYFAAAREMALPVLGICRGLQIINVIMGGSLWQDISLKGDNMLCHSSFIKRARYVHSVSVRPGSILSQVCSDVQEVNSIHHQGIKRLGHGLVSDAESPDGICEAFEGSEGPFLLALQWHPEHLFGHDAAADKIFRLFVSRCEK